MTLMEHLIELRRRIIVSVVAVAIGLSVGLVLGPAVIASPRAIPKRFATTVTLRCRWKRSIWSDSS